MTVLRFRGVTVVFVSSVFLRITFAAAAECDLEKIFRTPKDMSNVNFDHFEIVERNGFDRSDDSSSTTTTTEAAPVNKSKKSGSNVANAQVLLRFGGDDVHGSNHIMKIPPQCRHVYGKEAIDSTGYYHHHSPPYAYPPPCPPHYYHPYPPPVPFAFPNFYFSHYGDETRYLPPQLRQYFQRHRFNGFNSEEYSNNPVRRARDHIAHENHLSDGSNRIAFQKMSQPEFVLTRPRILKTLNLSNEEIEEQLAEKNDVKRDCSCMKSKSGEVEHKIDEDVVIETKKKHRKKCKKNSKNKNKISKQDVEDDDIDSMEKLLNDALVLYKCQNCSSPPKLLVSYPITHRDNHRIANELKPVLSSSSCTECSEPSKARQFNNDIESLGFFDTENIKDECRCINCQCHKRNNAVLHRKKFANDVDDLITVIFPDNVESDELCAPPLVPIPLLAKKLLAEADARQKSNYLLTGHSSFSNKASSSFYSQNGNSPAHISHQDYAIASGAGYKSDPQSLMVYQEPTEIRAASIKNIFPASVPEPATIIVTSDVPTERYLPHPQPVDLDDIVPLPYPSSPMPFPGCYFYPHAYESARREIERQHLLPKYLKVIPRDDLQIVPPQAPESPILGENDAAVYCRKCGHQPSDGAYCVNCGAVVYAVPNDGSPMVRYPELEHNLPPLIPCRVPYAAPRPSPVLLGGPQAHHGAYCLTCPRETRQLNEW